MARIQVRARAVDMLGRQQVAGIPTAISELFKNAHDAYARNVEVDFYRKRDLLILRDDGVGMSRADFESRWLTLGTESKADDSNAAPPPTDPNQALRPIMGEKGIGRLAIALIGPQVLILTRPLQAIGLGKLTAAFVNWTLFSVPGIDLSDIEIPIFEKDSSDLPTREEIAGLISSALKNAEEILEMQPLVLEQVRVQLRAFDVDPFKLAEELPTGPDLRIGSGTQFWISPVSELLPEDIDGAGSNDRATSFEKALLGFANTMTPGHIEPPIVAKFRDHTTDGLRHERIAEDNFFTPDEFQAADHHIQGTFDDLGQFNGSVQVYGKSPVPHLVHWSNPRGTPTKCGSFRIDFAYVQGNFRESRLPRDDYDRISEKLKKIGGLYIYRDGIRVLPYGDSDFDFLDVELRRNKGSGFYFFSYRRMFGVIEIARKANRSLIEKAGREGFQVNGAYRQFKRILENFLVQTAADFFREGGASIAAFEEEKSRLSREHILLEKRKKNVAKKRTDLTIALDEFFELVDDQFFDGAVDAALERIGQRASMRPDDTLTYDQLMADEKVARSELLELVRRATVSRPRGVGLTRELSKKWSRYEVERASLQADCFDPAFARLDNLVSDLASKYNISLDIRKMMGDVLVELGQRELRRAKSLRTEVETSSNDLGKRALSIAREGLQTVNNTIASTLITFEHTGPDQLSSERLPHTRIRLESLIMDVAEEQTELLARLRDQLKAAATPETLEGDEMLAALESELEERRERDLESLQLAQMGMAIGIVHHEFHAVIRGVRQNVRRLKTWADRNESLRPLYEDISRSYSHLDRYLSLFAPLNRRLTQTPVLIRGRDIKKYLGELLGERMHRHNIIFRTSSEFENAQITEHVSVIYPAFVNIVDNAIFWLTESNVGVTGRRITKECSVYLDYDGEAFIISDTGPGIQSVDSDVVFESGFSRKPGGSGLGLYITKTLLEQAGYELTMDPYKKGVGATFRIRLPELINGADGEEGVSDD